jgi:hypothetical protein
VYAAEVGAFRLIRLEDTTGRDKYVVFLSLLCVLLLGFIGFVQATHVHTENSKIPSHECSICSVAHSGALTSTVFRPVPLLVRTALIVSPDVVGKSCSVIFSLHIRPPPAV